jgi:hypothetical protein
MVVSLLFQFQQLLFYLRIHTNHYIDPKRLRTRRIFRKLFGRHVEFDHFDPEYSLWWTAFP